jgi:hypothetical protein
MLRPALLLTATLAIATVTVPAVPGIARAEPPVPCAFTLSPPQLVQVSGAPMVTATVEPGGCGMPASPYQSVACLVGADSVTQCAQASGGDTAQVYAPYRPGATYTSSGRGLGTWNGQWYPAQDWQILGPFTATL